MEKWVSGLPAEAAETFDLGLVLGENHALNLIAGRCSAAQAVILRRLREERKYRLVTPHWRDFCIRCLRISGSQADEIIRLLDEFGSGYFEMAHLTRISPETYRAIAPSIKDGALHANGEVIEIKEENSLKVAAAVAELRRSLPAKKRRVRQLAMHERLAELDKRSTALIAEFAEISRKERQGENWLQLTGVLTRVVAALRRIEQENGL